MPLPLPNLDDRDFEQLLADAKQELKRSCPEWTDLSAGDPGIVLLELFCHLTEQMIYRLNRLPDKAYISFLRLLGVVLQPPAAASVTLHFSRSRASDEPVTIPEGTRVTLSRADGGTEPPIFVTARAVTIASGEKEVDVLAYHCDLVQGELAGKGTGEPGLYVTAQRPPIIASTGDELDLVVGVQVAANQVDERVPAREFEGKTFRIWREVENFTDIGPDGFVYVADRMTGTIAFAPAARRKTEDGGLQVTPEPLAEAPGAGMEIRLSYRRGGGAGGNTVAANALTTLKDPIPGVQVTNPNAATGGRPMETLENALLRGPQELHSLERAVTASDFELIATKRSPAIARAKAATRATLWSFATPGTVEIRLVPYLTEQERAPGKVTVAVLQAHQTEEARQQIKSAIDERRPLGTTCLVNWARYKPVRVSARVVVRREEDLGAVKQRVLNRLYDTITPLPTKLNSTGWHFGDALHVSNVYDMALAEPGVRWIDGVRLLVDQAPDSKVSGVAADAFQARTWYAGSGDTLFRTSNDGDGWEPAGHFDSEQIKRVRVHPERSSAGLIAVLTSLPDGTSSRLYISRDAGETWEPESRLFKFRVFDLTWMLREGAPTLLLATDVGLYELALQPGSSAVQVLVDPAKQDLGFYAVEATTDVRGRLSVAVAAESNRGVYFSSEGGKTNTFRRIGLQGEDIRVLRVQKDGPRSFLWAGVTVSGGEEDPGKGCLRWEIVLGGVQDPPEGWVPFAKGWAGGSCQSLAFQGTTVVAGTYRGGVVRMDLQAADAHWQPPDINCGLPLRESGGFLFQPVETVAVDPQGQWIMAGGPVGVFRSQDRGVTYNTISGKEFSESVTLPETWLFVSGDHDIKVVDEDEAR